MSRGIGRYRGKRKDNGKWVEGNYIVCDGKSFIVKEGCCSSTYETFCAAISYDELIEVIPETVGEFTGLKDKNGVEIYEGDIVKLDTPGNRECPTRNRKVIFNQKFAQFCIDPCLGFVGWKSIEVIGNINEEIP